MRVCSGPGCLRAVRDSVRFCAECKPITPVVDAEATLSGIKDHTSGYDAEMDKLKTNSRWQRLRVQIVKRDPICRRCDLGLTAIVDHIVPAEIAISQARLSGRFPFDRFAGYFIKSNLQGLCRSCHGVKTLEDKTHVGDWPSVLDVEDAQPKRVFHF